MQALALRLAGSSYREIGATLAVSHQQAYKDVQAMLKTTCMETADEVRRNELHRLDALLAAHWKAAVGIPAMGDQPAVPPDKGATTTVLGIMDRRARLLGLDAPQRIDVTRWVREMAEAEGLDPEQAVRDAGAIVKQAAFG